MLRERFNDWYVKIIRNRRLLKRVFQIGKDSRDYFDRGDGLGLGLGRGGGGPPATRSFLLLSSVVLGWRSAALSLLRSRRLRILSLQSASMRRIGLLCAVFLGWQRAAYAAAVCKKAP